MKKYFIFLTLIFISSYITAQTQYGLRFSPQLLSLRAESQVDSLSIESNGLSLGFMTGIYFDRYMGGNAFFSTGIYYNPKKVVFNIKNSTADSRSDHNIKLQYLVFPASLKLFTNEIALDTKIYFQLGSQVLIKIHEDIIQNDDAYVKNMKGLGMELILSTGIERRISANGNLYIGFSYIRGLFNMLSDQFPVGEGLLAKNDLYSLDIAIRF